MKIRIIAKLILGASLSQAASANQDNVQVSCHTPNIADAGYLITITGDGDLLRAELNEQSFIGPRQLGVYQVRSYEQEIFPPIRVYEGEGFRLGFTLADADEQGRYEASFKATTQTGAVEGKVLCALEDQTDKRAINISMVGMGPMVDEEAYAELMQLVGDLVGRGNLSHFAVTGYGFEGGSAFCIQVSPFSEEGTLEGILARLGDIQPNPRTTSYSYSPVVACSR